MTAPTATPEGVATPEGILDLKTLGDASLSPDGARVAFVLSTVDSASMADTARIVVADLRTGQSDALTDVGALDVQPSWSADGRAVVCRSLSESGFQIHRIEVADRTRRALTDMPLGVGGVWPQCAPTGDAVAFSAPTAAPRDPSEPYIVDDPLWRIDGIGVLRDAVAELFVLHEPGAEPQQVSQHGDRVFVSVQWSPDGRRLLALALQLDDMPRWTLDLHELGGGWRTIWSSEFLFFPPAAAWLPDGRIVRTTENRLAEGTPPGLVATDGEGRELLTFDLPDWPFGVVQSDFPGFVAFLSPRIVVDRATGEAFVAVQRGGRSEIWRLRGDGSTEPAVAEDAVAVPVGAHEGRLLFASTTFHEPPDLRVAGSDGRRRLTTLNGDRFPTGAGFEVEPLTASTDGGEIEAWFLRPRGTDGPVPTVLNLHGGPAAAWGASFSYDDCVLTAAGYGVLLVNQRGSTGYTPEFARAIHDHWGEVDAADVLAVLDVAVERGLVDERRLGVWGISAGGFLAAWLTTHEARFRAAVIENPCLDWTIMLSSDIGLYIEPWLGAKAGTGEAAGARYARRSATSFAASSNTPTLLIAHEHDLRTPRAGAEAFYTVLRLHGVRARLLLMPGTPHQGSIDLGNPRVRVAQNRHLLDWFDTHLGRPGSA